MRLRFWKQSTPVNEKVLTVANNLIISYDLRKPGRNYEPVYEAIKSLGNWARVVESTWYVDTPYSSEQAFNIVSAKCDNNDALFVVNAKNNSVIWQNLPDDVSALIKRCWDQLY